MFKQIVALSVQVVVFLIMIIPHLSVCNCMYSHLTSYIYRFNKHNCYWGGAPPLVVLVAILSVCPSVRVHGLIYRKCTARPISTMFMQRPTVTYTIQLWDITKFQENVRILWECSQGLAYLHDEIGSRNRVTHCDVKRFVKILLFTFMRIMHIPVGTT